MLCVSGFAPSAVDNNKGTDTAVAGPGDTIPSIALCGIDFKLGVVSALNPNKERKSLLIDSPITTT